MKTVYVNVMTSEGVKEKVPLRKIKEYEQLIMADNIFHALKQPGIYTEKDIEEYERSAKFEYRNLMRMIAGNPDTVLALDKITKRFVIVEADPLLHLQCV